MKRVKMLYDHSTGVPTPFDIVFYKVVRDKRAEQAVHLLLNPYRVNSQREFFQVGNISTIREAFDTVNGRYVETTSDDGFKQDIYEVEAILADNGKSVRYSLYNVKWVGYDGSDETTWEPYEHIKHLMVFRDYLINRNAN